MRHHRTHEQPNHRSTGISAVPGRGWLPEDDLRDDVDDAAFAEAIRRGRRAEYDGTATDLELRWAS